MTTIFGSSTPAQAYSSSLWVSAARSVLIKVDTHTYSIIQHTVGTINTQNTEGYSNKTGKVTQYKLRPKLICVAQALQLIWVNLPYPTFNIDCTHREWSLYMYMYLTIIHVHLKIQHKKYMLAQASPNI